MKKPRLKLLALLAEVRPIGCSVMGTFINYVYKHREKMVNALAN